MNTNKRRDLLQVGDSVLLEVVLSENVSSVSVDNSISGFRAGGETELTTCVLVDTLVELLGLAILEGVDDEFTLWAF